MIGTNEPKPLFAPLYARWKVQKKDKTHYDYFCSNCATKSRFKKSPYCPNCGRQMIDEERG